MDSAALWLGVIGCGLATAAGLLPISRRARIAALLAALALAPVVIAADNWDSAQLAELRDRPALALAALLAGGLLLGGLATAFRRRPALVVVLAVAALPLRIPIDLAGSSANLLLPLYVVVGAGLLAAALRERDASPPVEPPNRAASGYSGLIGPLLAAFVVVYALQAGYADDISPAVESVCFFFAPFAALFFLLGEVRWDRRLIAVAAGVLVVEALLAAAIGFGQYLTGELFWNEKVIAGNEAHAWFRVNSIFFDPNIMGRYLAIAMIAVAAFVAWSPDRRRGLAGCAVFAVLLIALGITFSQSSLLALLAGMLVLGLARWGALAAALTMAALLAAMAVSIVAIDGGDLTSETTGRTGLISGGLELAEQRPLVGYGSGSFAPEFKQRFGGGDGIAVASHTEPITVAAEQGAIGLLPYGALVLGAFAALLARSGLGLRSPARDPLAATLLAAFAAMVVHSLGYAAFFSDPITWALLGLAALLPAARAAPVPTPSTPGPTHPQPDPA